jgi:ribosome-binding factor A
MTENLRDARVYVTVEGTEEEKKAAMLALRKAAPYVRRQLGTALPLRYTPEIHFMRDTIEESAARVDAVLSEMKKDGQLRPPPPTTEAEESDEKEERIKDEE